jgi:hypothetical protein
MVTAGSPARRRLWLLALFLATTVGFVACRYSSFTIWDDSPYGFHPREGEGMPRWERELRVSRWRGLRTLTAEAFAAPNNRGYRPLAEIWAQAPAPLLNNPTALPLSLLLVIGALHGAFAVALFAVARRHVHTDLAALGAVGLVLASPPLVASSWVCVAGVQVVVPLFFCLSLLCHASIAAGRRRLLSYAVLFLLLLVGPWVREFFGMNALLILFLEWRRARRPTWLMGVAALGLLHFLFPTALVHWLCYPDLPIKPVFRLGSLGDRMDAPVIHWEAAWHFLPLLPPLLWVCGGAEALARLAGTGWSKPPERGLWTGIEHVVQVVALPCWLVLLTVALAVPEYRPCAGVVLCLGLAALAASRDPFLAFWFVLMFVPILRVFTEHVHFLYAMPPAAIILAQAAESLWRRLRERPRVAWVRYALAGLLAVIGVDQALNVYGAYRVNHAAYEGIDAVAAWFANNVPAGAAVVSNVIHGEEIKWHSGNHFQNYWSVGAGVSDSRRALEDPAQVNALLADSDRRPVYFLDVEFDYLPNKAAYHRNKYVHNMDVAKRDRGVVHVTRAHYVFCDPLRYLIPRAYQPFLGAPDLVNDFCYDRSQHHLFRNDLHAFYHVYEVTGKHLEPRLEGPVRLEREGVDGFNILRVGPGFLAIPQAEGHFDIDKFHAHGYSVQFSGSTVEAVQRQIEGLRTSPQ